VVVRVVQALRTVRCGNIKDLRDFENLGGLFDVNLNATWNNHNLNGIQNKLNVVASLSSAYRRRKNVKYEDKYEYNKTAT
jgi:hypothetical protein